ncbi:MAG TPA: glycine cleavage system aminomethyltransferase GcvT [Actinomycetota bacterium]|nr:glycine cleavage system aminomethyltransferase GcvT [Actinomycetota bacterium]
MADPKHSPLNAVHKDAGGRFVTFAGWRLPVHYGSILDEARAVRGHAGMFDVSHMGRVRVRGTDALAAFQRLGTNDLRKISPGKAQYTVWCTPDGGTIDDLIVFWLAPEEFLVVFNASRRTDDLQHLEEHASGDVTILDETEGSAMIAVQGPEAIDNVKGLGLQEKLPRFGVARSTIAGVSAIASRTGYTGEDGIEIVCEAGAGPRVWEALRERGVVPCGLGARDALRMEMGLPLYGHELSLDTTPLEAGLSFAVSIDDREFVGRDALAKQAAAGPPRVLAGFVCLKPAVPQQGDEIGPGVVTSGGTSVVLDAPIGLAFVPAGASLGPDTLRTRGKEIPCELRALPLIDRKRPTKKQ